jgi:hypothetical protein
MNVKNVGSRDFTAASKRDVYSQFFLFFLNFEA